MREGETATTAGLPKAARAHLPGRRRGRPTAGEAVGIDRPPEPAPVSPRGHRARDPARPVPVEARTSAATASTASKASTASM